MRRVSVCALLVLASCGPPGAPGAGPSGPARVIETGDGMYIDLATDSRGSSAQFSASAEQVWSALPAAYQELGITPGTVDRSTWTFGNRRVQASRRFAGAPMATLFRCGNTVGGAPAANTYRIQMAVVTQLQPLPSGRTEARTTVQATGTSTAGTSTSAVACSSTGVLEERLASEIRARVGG